MSLDYFDDRQIENALKTQNPLKSLVLWSSRARRGWCAFDICVQTTDTQVFVWRNGKARTDLPDESYTLRDLAKKALDNYLQPPLFRPTLFGADAEAGQALGEQETPRRSN